MKLPKEDRARGAWDTWRKLTHDLAAAAGVPPATAELAASDALEWARVPLGELKLEAAEWMDEFQIEATKRFAEVDAIYRGILEQQQTSALFRARCAARILEDETNRPDASDLVRHVVWTTLEAERFPEGGPEHVGAAWMLEDNPQAAEARDGMARELHALLRHLLDTMPEWPENEEQAREGAELTAEPGVPDGWVLRHDLALADWWTDMVRRVGSEHKDSDAVELAALKARTGILAGARERWDQVHGIGTLPGVEDGAGNLWSLWCTAIGAGVDPHQIVSFLPRLGLALWRLLWGPRAQRRAFPPAVVAPMFERITDLMSARVVAGECEGSPVLLDGSTGAVVALADPAAVRAVLLDPGPMQSVHAYRLLRWLLAQVTNQWAMGSADPRVVVVDGGYRALAEAIGGSTSNKAQTGLKDVARAGRALVFELPGGVRTNLWSLSEISGHRGRRAQVRFTMGDALVPGAVFKLPQRYNRLVPLVDLPKLKGRDAPKLANLATRWVLTMAERSAELARHGSVLVSPSDRAAMAERAAVTVPGEKRALDRWLLDGDDGPAFLRRIGRTDRYTLGDAHKAEREMLIDRGKRESQGSAAAKRRRKKTGKRSGQAGTDG